MKIKISMPSFIKDLGRSWLGLLISVACLAAVFYVADLETLEESLRLADYRYFPIALGLFLVSIVFRAIAWRILLREEVGLGRVFITLNEGYLLNNLLPFRLGEIGRGFLLNRTADKSFLQVMSTILIERIFDIMMVVSILLITLPFVVGVSWAKTAALIVGAVIIVVLIILHLLGRNQDWAMKTFSRVQARINALQKVSEDDLTPFFQGLSALTDLRSFLLALGWMSMSWILVILEYYLILLAFVPEAKLIWAALGIGVVGLGVAIPSAPGAVGIVQGTIVGVFPPIFSIDPSVALAYSITVHGLYLVITSLLGIVGLLIDGASLADIYHQIRDKAFKLRQST